MDATKSQILDDILHKFETSTSFGFGFLSDSVTALMATLLLIAITFTGFRMMFGGSAEIITAGRKAMLWMVIAYLVNSWQTNTELVRQTALVLGFRAAGIKADPDSTLVSPSYVVDLGLQQLSALMASGTTDTGWGVNLPNWDAGILFLAGLVILIAFVVVALQLLITTIEFKLLTLASFILIPFGILTRTSFLMERSLGYVASSGLKFLTLAFITAISMAIVTDFNANHISPDTVFDTSDAYMMMVTAIVIAGLAISIPATAAGLISGGPSLGIGALAGGAAVGAGAAVGVAGAAGAAAATGGAAATSGAGGMMAQIQAAMGAGGGTLKSAGSLVGKASGVSAGAAASQGPRGGIGDTSSGSEGNS